MFFEQLDVSKINRESLIGIVIREAVKSSFQELVQSLGRKWIRRQAHISSPPIVSATRLFVTAPLPCREFRQHEDYFIKLFGAACNIFTHEIGAFPLHDLLHCSA